jgi:EAL domain-containing protein (putative c-di-GMP-specific phosphodiesterase class I)/GGDEF domain-containing protein
MGANPIPLRSGASRPVRALLASSSASWTDADRQFHASVSIGLETPSCGIGVFVVDLPGLLEIAETYGDRARQALLQKIEWRLQSLFGTDAVARTAVMRFSLLLQGVLEQDVASVVERIQAAVCGRQSSVGAGVVIVGLPTVGVALTGKLDGQTRNQPVAVADLIRHAELALQQAVSDRPGTYRLYSVAMDAALRDRTQLRQALLRAIDRQEFRLAYQPIVDLQTQATVGLEALIRWHAPPLGISADPGTFIQAAEETGLIVPIGAQVLNMAASQMRRWTHRGFPPPRVAVNVSGLQLQDPNFASFVLKTLEGSGLAPSNLELELTERTLVDSSPNTIRMLEYMRNTGIEFAVDDFGTGYSSLRYLQELPIAKLKIDRSFITSIGEGGRQVALVDAMLGLAANLDLKVVAEGIETEQQMSILRGKGCQSGQGYLFSPALPAEDAHRCFMQSWDVN